MRVAEGHAGSIRGFISFGWDQVLGPLLELYGSVDAEAAAVQAALLEEVTYANVVRAGGEQAFAKGKQGARWLADLIGIRRDIDTTIPRTTADRVLERAAYWREKRTETIHQAVMAVLAERLQADVTAIGSMSTRLIEEAAAGYGISEDLLLGQMAEAVAKRYLEECVEGLKDTLRAQNDKDILITEDLITEQLGKMSAAERLEIQKALHLKTLSGTSVRCAFLTTGLPGVGIAALQAGGFGTYLALTTIMHAVFTSMLGMTLPFAAYTTASSAFINRDGAGRSDVLP